MLGRIMAQAGWRELVASHLQAAALALRAHQDGECVRQFGIAAGYLLREARGGEDRAGAQRMQHALVDNLSEGDKTQRLDLAKIEADAERE
jgi:hypothetical protein